MKTILSILLLLAAPGAVWADDCASVRSSLGLPLRLKLTGKPKQARWGHVEKALTLLREQVEGTGCRLRFGEVFTSPRPDAYFPLIGNLLRTAPEDELVGASVYSQAGRRLGTFSNRVTFEKKGPSTYTTYYFQFEDGNGQLQSSGNRVLVDGDTGKPFFLLHWPEIEQRILVDGSLSEP